MHTELPQPSTVWLR